MKPWENPLVHVPDGEEYRAGGDTHVTYSLTEMKYRFGEKQKSNDFLRTSRLKRERREKDAEEQIMLTLSRRTRDPEGTDIGLPGAMEALPSPRIPLPDAKEPLWLERPMKVWKEAVASAII